MQKQDKDAIPSSISLCLNPLKQNLSLNFQLKVLLICFTIFVQWTGQQALANLLSVHSPTPTVYCFIKCVCDYTQLLHRCWGSGFKLFCLLTKCSYHFFLPQSHLFSPIFLVLQYYEQRLVERPLQSRLTHAVTKTIYGHSISKLWGIIEPMTHQPWQFL